MVVVRGGGGGGGGARRKKYSFADFVSSYIISSS